MQPAVDNMAVNYCDNSKKKRKRNADEDGDVDIEVGVLVLLLFKILTDTVNSIS